MQPSHPTTPAEQAFLLAIDFGGTKIAMATATPQGERLAELEIPTQAHDGAARVMTRMHDAAAGLIAQTRQKHGGKLGAVAAVTPGIVEANGIRLAPNNPGWETLAMADTLRRQFDVENVRVETDAKAAALAEARCGALKDLSCGLYVNLGTGLAAAAVIDGKVLRGAHGAAGEIAYQLRGVPGEVPFADGGAPLEQFVSGRALADRASALLGQAVSCRQAFDLAPAHPEVAALLDQALDVLVVHVVNIVLTLDPERIAVGGGMARVPRIIQALTQGLARTCPYPPQVVLAAFEQGAALQGAILCGMEALG
ncbi:MAG: ROK family protein [Paludibacterium sp.]|uniref:ROK family protein n=1 Tax=Paludibacterium sp. TaxID=1917523 RepID=UPI0025DE57C7|nr:ROK family protein [Paludibacterium sp.]MBV8047635.1 ROK family protein [Paludibacterium sp.]MBV8647317.1 ROK family protein [Paludibacterium sp.]